MAVSKQRTSGKSGKNAPVSARAKTPVASGVSASSKTVSKPVAVAPSSSIDAPVKRVVVTSSEIEAAAKQEDVSLPEKIDALPASEMKAQPASAAATSVDDTAAQTIKTAEDKSSARVMPADVPETGETKVAVAATELPKAAGKSDAAPKTAGRKVAKPKSDSKPASVAKTASAKPVKPVSSSKTERASTVSTTSKSVAAKKTTIPAAPKQSTAPATAASKSVAKSAAPTETAAPKLEAKPALASNNEDAFGFGAMFMDPNVMERYLALWKAPEIDAIMAAGNDAMEEGMTVASEAFTKLFETMTGQSDVFSDAGSRLAAQCEELIETHQKNIGEAWQASMAVLEKTGGIGTELATWMQRELEASQADIDAFAKAESVSDIQELQSKILARYVESSVAEGEKVQEIMLAAMADSFNAMSKAANVALK